MVEKTLSSGTLNLRFMQRASQHPRIEPDQAHVKDDAQWEVSPEIRQSWGLDPYRGEKALTYETSYLPFLFPSLHDTSTADAPSSLSPSDTLPPRGRRVFNNTGPQPVPKQPPTRDHVNVDKPIKSSRPHSISSSARKSSRDAKNLVFDMSGVGADLRHPSSSVQPSAFLRPAGVDDPAPAHVPKRKVTRSRTSGEADEPRKKTKLTLIE